MDRASDHGRKSVIVTNRDDATLEIFDATTLALRSTIPVAAQPEQIVISLDGTMAFVTATAANQISVVDLRRNVLLTNLPLPGKPDAMLLKPDGGELYVTVPEAHELAIINTWTHELAESMLVGSAPTHGAMSSDGTMLYVSDSDAGHMLAAQTTYRTLQNPDAPVTVGNHPGDCALVPSGDLLVAVDQSSNDLAVIRIREQTLTLITLIPVGNSPREVALKLF